MRITETDITAWRIACKVLSDLHDQELEFLPEIAEAFHSQHPSIGNQPGAFEFDANTLTTLAAAIFAVALPFIKDAVPKLIDASIDVTKESFKKRIEANIARNTQASLPSHDAVKLNELVRSAALKQKLSIRTAEALANAVVAELAISCGIPQKR